MFHWSKSFELSGGQSSESPIALSDAQRLRRQAEEKYPKFTALLKELQFPMVAQQVTFDLFLVTVRDHVAPHYNAMVAWRDDRYRTRADGVAQTHAALDPYKEYLDRSHYDLLDSLSLTDMYSLVRWITYFYEVSVAVI